MGKLEVLIKKQLDEKEVTVKSITEKIGISKQYFSVSIKNPSYPPNDTLKQIADILKVNQEVLLSVTHEDWLNRKGISSLPASFKKGFEKTAKLLSIEDSDELELIKMVRKDKWLTKDLINIAKALVVGKKS